jgi:hypothetical protein
MNRLALQYADPRTTPPDVIAPLVVERGDGRRIEVLVRRGTNPNESLRTAALRAIHLYEDAHHLRRSPDSIVRRLIAFRPLPSLPVDTTAAYNPGSKPGSDTVPSKVLALALPE